MYNCSLTKLEEKGRPDGVIHLLRRTVPFPHPGCCSSSYFSIRHFIVFVKSICGPDRQLNADEFSAY